MPRWGCNGNGSDRDCTRGWQNCKIAFGGVVYRCEKSRRAGQRKGTLIGSERGMGAMIRAERMLHANHVMHARRVIETCRTHQQTCVAIHRGKHVARGEECLESEGQYHEHPKPATGMA